MKQIWTTPGKDFEETWDLFGPDDNVHKAKIYKKRGFVILKL